MKRILDSKHPTRADRQARYRRGHMAEHLAAALLVMKGYRILARRFRSGAGEIDLIAARRDRVAFVEVKHRATFEQAQQAMSARQRERIIRTAEQWLSRHPHYQHHEFGLDLMLLAPWRLPRHLPNAFHRPWYGNHETGY